MELPKDVDIEVSRVCNLGCILCPRNKNIQGVKYLTPSILEHILNSIPSLERLTFIGGGEPLLNPYLEDLLNLTYLRGIRVRLTTNGILVTPGIARIFRKFHLWKVAVSLDSLKQDLLEVLRPGASVEKIREAIWLLKLEDLDVRLHFLLYRSNIQELYDIVTFCIKMGIMKLEIITPKYDRDCEEDFIWGRPSLGAEVFNHLEEIKKFGKSHGLRISRSPYLEPTFCNYYCSSQCYITAEEDIYTCLFMVLQGNGRGTFEEYYYGSKVEVPPRNFYMGNMVKSSFLEVWNSPAYHEFRSFFNKTKRKEGETISREKLIDIRKNKTPSRFSYCKGCLVRWNQACEA
jgi:MoaA/NifB/PqqE/SkfB family radical SAM enzyme